jgi:predicted ribosome quality control (RQC) complex YloA/Tae2 family protein
VHQQTIEEIVAEIRNQITGRFAGKILQLSPLSLAIDFGLREAGYLFLSVEPSEPRLYLIKRNKREFEKQSIPAAHFAQATHTVLGGRRLIAITKLPAERIVRFDFADTDEGEQLNRIALMAQLTGRSANLYLVDHDSYITHALRPPRGMGQQIGERYDPPPPQTKQAQDEHLLSKGDFGTLSEAADDYYRQREADESKTAKAKALLGTLKKDLAQNRKLQTNLRKDLASHGDPEQHKRKGDLLLANIANARRIGNRVTLTDYYSQGAPEIEIEIDENVSLQDEASRYFSRYAKAKRAKSEIGKRLDQIAETISKLEKRKTELETAIITMDESVLAELEGPRDSKKIAKRKKKRGEKLSGVRHYRSTDGYEILVGRTAQVNDQLTFRVAGPHDLWVHAADYPGSHVIVRNHTRNEIPHRTIIEAAQIAAKFSQASDDSKVIVHYAQRKFLAKPKGAAAGLVRMSRFRTVVVQPAENIPRIIEPD